MQKKDKPIWFWRILDKKKVKMQFQFEPRDLWFGLFWRTLFEMPKPYYTLHLYFVFIPMVPLHVTILLRKNSMKKEKKPITIHEAVAIILDHEKNDEEFKNNDPAMYHQFTGRWIRNNWDLWQPDSQLHQEFNKIGIFHADDMSMILLDTAHRIVNNEPVNLVEQIKKCHDHWNSMGCDFKGNKKSGGGNE